MSLGSAYPPPDPGKDDTSGYNAYNYGYSTVSGGAPKRAKVHQGATGPSYAASYDKNTSVAGGGGGYYGYTGQESGAAYYSASSDYTGGQGYFTSTTQNMGFNTGYGGGPRGGGAQQHRGRGGGGRGRGGKRDGKPKGPPPLTSEQKQNIENNNMRHLVAPKPPHKILNEMLGCAAKYTYTANPPLPPGADQTAEMHTLITTIDWDTSSGTGPTNQIAKNICAEHAIMGVVARRYEAINDMAHKGIKSKQELMLDDETPFELASVAIFKMLNEWESKGVELPEDLNDVLYTAHTYWPVKHRLGWIRGSNMGFSTPLPARKGSESGYHSKRPISAEEASSAKSPVGFLNELRGTVDYQELGSWGQGEQAVFSIGVNIDGIAYSGTGSTKKDAKRNCAIDILTRLYKVNVPRGF